MATWNSRGLRGSTLEDLINRTNEKYQENGLALIQKIPTPITPIRIDKDERHICPLQLTVIKRAINLWSNPGDTVLSPFGGIGSEPVTALELGRRAIAIELKDSYYRQMVKNCEAVTATEQTSLF